MNSASKYTIESVPTPSWEKSSASLVILGIHDPLPLNASFGLVGLDLEGKDAVDLLDEVLAVRRQLFADQVERLRRPEVAR